MCVCMCMYAYTYIYIYICSIIHLVVHYLLLLSFSFFLHCFHCCFLFSFGLLKFNTRRSGQGSTGRCSGNIVLSLNG